MTGYPHPTSPAVTAVMKGNKRADTSPEMALRSRLHRAGLRFRKDKRIDLGERKVRPDIVFTRQRLAIFVDGCFWHLCPEHGRVPGGRNADYWHEKLTGNRRRDLQDTELLQEDGWRVLRFWEHTSPDEAAAHIHQIISDLATT